MTTERVLRDIWDKHVPIMAKELGIPEPKLVIELNKDIGFYMYTQMEFKISALGRLVELTSKDSINVYKPLWLHLLGVNKKVKENVILAFLAHECRHIWQLYHAKQERITEANEYLYKPFDSQAYSRRPSEIDANEYASTKVSKPVMRLIKLMMYELPSKSVSNTARNLARSIKRGESA